MLLKNRYLLALLETTIDYILTLLSPSLLTLLAWTSSWNATEKNPIAENPLHCWTIPVEKTVTPLDNPAGRIWFTLEKTVTPLDNPKKLTCWINT